MGNALEQLVARNGAALAAAANTSLNFEQKLQQFPYYGFIECEIFGAAPFLMFSNNDDAVAQHFLYRQKPGFEAASMRLWVALCRQSRMGIFDVGAFSGVYALAARATTRSVPILAFEPARNTFNRLVNNIWVNHFDDQIAPLNFALGSKTSRERIRHPHGVYVLGSGESILPSVIKEAWYEEDIDVFAGDDIPQMRERDPRRFVIGSEVHGCDVAKIDVEGYECSVLEGMADLIQRDRTSLLIECLDLDAFHAVDKLLGPSHEHWFVDETELALHKSEQRFMARYSRNVLFAHRELAVAPIAAAAEVAVQR